MELDQERIQRDIAEAQQNFEFDLGQAAKGFFDDFKLIYDNVRM